MNSTQINQAFIRLKNIFILEVDDLKRILEKVKIDRTKGCWFYNKDWSEYASFRGQALHRIIYEAFNGPLIPSRYICHKCDRKGCINPDHLYQGNPSTNLQDMHNRIISEKVDSYVVRLRRSEEASNEYRDRSR